MLFNLNINQNKYYIKDYKTIKFNLFIFYVFYTLYISYSILCYKLNLYCSEFYIENGKINIETNNFEYTNFIRMKNINILLLIFLIILSGEVI